MKKGTGVYQFIMSKYFTKSRFTKSRFPKSRFNKSRFTKLSPWHTTKKRFLKCKSRIFLLYNNLQDALYLYKNKWYDFLENLSTNFSAVFMNSINWENNCSLFDMVLTKLWSYLDHWCSIHSKKNIRLYT